MFQFNGMDTYGSKGPGGGGPLSGAVNLASGLYGLMGGGYNNPADSAKPYIDKIPSTVAPYYQPYIDAGNRALPQLEENYGKLINSPGDLYSKLSEGYARSPGYGYAMREGRNAIDQAAAAGGMLGSPDHERNAGQMTIDLSNADFDKYMDFINKYYMTGLQGEEGLNKMGYDAGTEYGGIQANNLINQANLAYKGTANDNQNTSDSISSILKSFGDFSFPGMNF